eukprot:TRINITY_DN50025_c0_g1_i1.p1 TRINITY_DN50025_c0_g1~~TRINITY_DN50025_c0_g1_i1.p1  ORF type:complete len:163 (-),score=66.03 TRINITY_DN50025_c0_g1_i1:55-480(-)
MSAAVLKPLILAILIFAALFAVARSEDEEVDALDAEVDEEGVESGDAEGMNRDFAEELIKESDSDGNKLLSLQELLDMVAKHSEGEESPSASKEIEQTVDFIKTKYPTYDADSNGGLDAQELSDMLEAYEAAHPPSHDEEM